MSKTEKYEVVRGGLFGADGREIEVGSRFDLSEVPANMSTHLKRVKELEEGASFITADDKPVPTTTSGGEGGADENGVIDYDKMNVPALRELAAGRTPPVVLETSDRKADIIAKLTADDKQREDGAYEQEEGEIDRAALEQSAITLGIQGYEDMSDEELLAAVEKKLGDDD